MFETKYRPATIEQPAKDKNAPFKGTCPACVDKGRRGAQVNIKGSNSNDRNNWWQRHKNHHLLEEPLVGLRF